MPRLYFHFKQDFHWFISFFIIIFTVYYTATVSCIIHNFFFQTICSWYHDKTDEPLSDGSTITMPKFNFRKNESDWPEFHFSLIYISMMETNTHTSTANDYKQSYENTKQTERNVKYNTPDDKRKHSGKLRQQQRKIRFMRLRRDAILDWM